MAFKPSTPQTMPLEALLSNASDLVLVFDAGERVPGHSFVLKQWSGVLAGLLASDCTSSSSSSSSSSSKVPKLTIIPMPGTSKKDWLTAMQFAYPVVPAPDITWDNCLRGALARATADSAAAAHRMHLISASANSS
jgi:hypothetical protein